MPQSEEEESRVIKENVIRLLKLAGVICFDVDDALGPELEEQIKSGAESRWN